MPQQSFNHKWESKVRDLGDLTAKVVAVVSGSVSNPDAAMLASASAKEIEFAAKKKLFSSLDVGGKATLGKEQVEAIGSAMREKSVSKVRDALLKVLGIEGMLSSGGFYKPFEIEGGLEASVTPFLGKVSVPFNEKLTVGGAPLHFSLKIEFTMCVGLSERGLQKIVNKIGGETVKRFFASAGRHMARLLAVLVESGILAAAGYAAVGVAASVGYTYLAVEIIHSAHESGRLKGMATWYSLAYVRKLFEKGRTGTINVRDGELIRALIAAGERDAVRDARIVSMRAGEEDHATADANEILRRYRERVIAQYGSERSAEPMLRSDLNGQTERKLGLKDRSISEWVSDCFD